MSRCIPVGTCIFCGNAPAQLPSYGYCVACQQAGIPGTPGSHYPRCGVCSRYHAPIVGEIYRYNDDPKNTRCYENDECDDERDDEREKRHKRN